MQIISLQNVNINTHTRITHIYLFIANIGRFYMLYVRALMKSQVGKILGNVYHGNVYISSDINIL